MKAIIVFYSMYGHIYRMAQAVAEGVRSVSGAEAVLRRVPETLPADVLQNMGAADAQQTMSAIPVCTVEELASADAIIFGRIDDPESRVSKAAFSERGFKLLEDLGTLPKVTYLKGGSPNGSNS